MAEVVPLNDALISRLAREIARNIVPLSKIRESYRLTQDQLDDLVDTPFFRQRLTEEQAVWSASDPMSIVNRIGTKAATMVEESLYELFNLVHDKAQPMSAKVEALKMASRWAGIGENSNVKGVTDDARVRITINIGETKMEFDKQRALPATVIEGEAVTLTPDSVR